MPREIGKNYLRIRIRNPALFKKDSFRTLDVGRTGHHKLIRGRLKSNNEYKTQAILIEKKHAKTDKIETRKIIEQAKRY